PVRSFGSPSSTAEYTPQATSEPVATNAPTTAARAHPRLPPTGRVSPASDPAATRVTRESDTTCPTGVSTRALGGDMGDPLRDHAARRHEERAPRAEGHPGRRVAPPPPQHVDRERPEQADAEQAEAAVHHGVHPAGDRGDLRAGLGRGDHDPGDH